MLRYPVPWDLVAGLWGNVARAEPCDLDALTAEVAARIRPDTRYCGLERLPESPRFVLAAKHYERKGLWIAHSAALLTQLVSLRYDPGSPPVRWVVTAGWPPLRVGRWRYRSPGNWLLRRVARALGGYPVAFAGADPACSARGILALLRDARTADRPIGIFPEGVHGAAGRITEPLPGSGRLVARLARLGFPVVPACISETDRLVIRIGNPISCEEVLGSAHPARLVMSRIASLCRVS